MCGRGGRRKRKRGGLRHIGLTKKQNIFQKPPSRLPFILHWHQLSHTTTLAEEVGWATSTWKRMRVTMFGWDQLQLLLRAGHTWKYHRGLGWLWRGVQWAQPGWGSLYHTRPILWLPSQMTLVFLTKVRASLLFWLLAQVKWQLFLCTWAMHLSLHSISHRQAVVGHSSLALYS